ncbi:MAG: protein kinase [Nannocystaceae bacterium]
MTIRLDLDALDDMPTGVVRAPRGPDPAPPPPAPAPAPPTPADEYAIEYDEWDAEPPTHEVVLSPDVLADREATVVAAPPSAPAAAPVDGDAALRAELLSGGRVGRYTILRPLERGAASLLFLAQDEVGGRKVTLGLLRGDHAQTEAGRARLGREAQLLAGLVHPNVVTVHEVGAYAGRIYVAMTPVDGRPLRAWLDLEERRWGAIVEVLVGAGRGLAAAHEVGLVHRDFKASSVLVDEQGEARVVDFGLALADGGGSPATMAPSSSSATRPTRAPINTRSASSSRRRSTAAPFAGKTVDDRRRELAARVEPDFPAAATSAVDPRGAPPGSRGRSRGPLPDDVGARRHPRARGRRRRRCAADRPGPGGPRPRPRPGHRRGPGPPQGLRGVAAGVLVLFVAIFLLTRGGSPAACDGDDPLAALWDQRREAIHGALTATAVPFAEDTWGRVAPRLDAYAAALRAQEAEACAARGRDAAGDAEARRRACLDRRRGAFKALTDALASADDKAALGAMAAAGELPPRPPAGTRRPSPPPIRRPRAPRPRPRRTSFGGASRPPASTSSSAAASRASPTPASSSPPPASSAITASRPRRWRSSAGSSGSPTTTPPRPPSPTRCGPPISPATTSASPRRWPASSSRSGSIAAAPRRRSALVATPRP